MSLSLLRLAHSKNKVSILKNSLALAKFFSTTPKISTNENNINMILKSAFPEAKVIDVRDVSGGCGAMYEIIVEAPQFKGLSIVKQHRLITEVLTADMCHICNKSSLVTSALEEKMVTRPVMLLPNALKEEIKDMHGLRIHTSPT